MKKSRLAMLGFALACATQNGAKVVFYVSSHEVAKECFDQLSVFAEQKGYEANKLWLTYTWPNGGKLTIRYLDDDNRNRDGGLMITHAFVDDDLSWSLKLFAESRVRASADFRIEAGLYTSDWARVCKDY